MAVLTKRAVCNYSAGSHLVTLQNKSVINEAAQNRCRNERITHLYLAESRSCNRYCLMRIFPKLVLWGFLSFSHCQWRPCRCWGNGKALHSSQGLGSQVSLPPTVNWVGDRGRWGQLYLQCPRGDGHVPSDPAGHRCHGTGGWGGKAGKTVTERYCAIGLVHRRRHRGWASQRSRWP